MNEKQVYRMMWRAIVILLFINVGLISWLWFNAPQNRRPPDFFLEKELNFDESQKESYRKLRTEYFSKVRVVRDSVKEAKEAFLKTIPQNLSEQELWKASTKVENINIQLNVLTYKHLQAVRQLCTPEQLKKFNQIIDEIAFQMAKPPQPPPPRERDNHPPPPDGNEPLPPR